MHALHERDLIYIFPFPFLRKPAYLIAKKMVNGKSCAMCSSCLRKLLSEIFQPHFIYLFTPPTSRVYLHRNWCVCSQMVHKYDKESIERDLLVNVNNSSITIEFLNMILSLSHVIFMSSRFRLMYGFYSLAPTGGNFCGIFWGNQKCWKEFFEIFFVTLFDLGRPAMSKKSEDSFAGICWLSRGY